MTEVAMLLGGAFVAGLIDAVVGGGGLIQIPLLFGAYPNGTAAAIFGTNKLAAVFGTASAAVRYAGRARLPWRAVLPASGAALACAYLGAMTVTAVPVSILKPLVLILLIGVAVYTWVRKDFGRVDRELVIGHRHVAGALLLGSVIGFYDGFFGPGTGSFLIFLFIRFFGFDFLRASASAKVVNVMTNIAALSCFGASGDVIWKIGLGMAAFNVLGALLGTQLALKRGSGFVRRIFLIVVSVLILRFALDLLA